MFLPIHGLLLITVSDECPLIYFKFRQLFFILFSHKIYKKAINFRRSKGNTPEMLSI